MNSRQENTLRLIFERPARKNIKWDAVVSLMSALGAEIDYSRSGSRVAFIIGGDVHDMHKPHKAELKPYMVEGLRNYLTRVGIKP